MPQHDAPGVHVEKTAGRAPAVGVSTSTAGFVGKVADDSNNKDHIESHKPKLCTNFGEFRRFVGDFSRDEDQNRLVHAVYGFFKNGGTRCYVALRKDGDDIAEVLKRLETIDEIAIVAAPGLLDPAAQDALITHCESKGDRFALLDGPQCSGGKGAVDPNDILRARARDSSCAALYFPWIKVYDPVTKGNVVIPPSGHVAGVYARSDARVGVHKAPANERLEGALDLEVDVDSPLQAALNPKGINCLRSFPGRGIRVWGARTLSSDPNWTYINVRRLFITAGRWIERNMDDAVFEPNDQRLWARIERELTAYFQDLFARGALKGRTAEEAFYIKCDAETNPPEVRDAGKVVIEIGLASAVPNEFLVIRISHGAGGISLSGPQ